MAKGEIAALKEALCNQYFITKKLYVELEEEREASATAATEALSMILRLQREKAAEKMEASQYKRMAEERINHAEESLAILEEVIQQKELEIESLRFQLKQTNLGINIPDFGEMMLCENKSCCNGVFRRNSSLPSLRGNEFCSDKGFLDDESHILSSEISLWRKIGENEVDDFFEELVADKGKPGWKYQAEEASRRVKKSMKFKNSTIRSCSSVASNEVQSTSSPIGSMGSWFSAPSSDDSTDSTKRTFSMVEMRNMMPKEAGDQFFGDEEGLMSNHGDCNFSMPGKEAIMAKASTISTPKEGASVNYQWPLMDPGDGNATSCSEIEQLRRRLQKLEDERVILQEDSERGKKQLREMLKQLNTIETHIKRPTSRKSSPMDESSLVSIMEAVLSFSI